MFGSMRWRNTRADHFIQCWMWLLFQKTSSIGLGLFMRLKAICRISLKMEPMLLIFDMSIQMLYLMWKKGWPIFGSLNGSVVMTQMWQRCLSTMWNVWGNWSRKFIRKFSCLINRRTFSALGTSTTTSSCHTLAINSCSTLRLSRSVAALFLYFWKAPSWRLCCITICSRRKNNLLRCTMKPIHHIGLLIGWALWWPRWISTKWPAICMCGTRKDSLTIFTSRKGMK